MKANVSMPSSEACTIVHQIDRLRMEWCIELLDETIENLVRSAEKWGIKHINTNDYYYEVEGMLHFAMTAGIISPDDYGNIIGCLHGLLHDPLKKN